MMIGRAKALAYAVALAASAAANTAVLAQDTPFTVTELANFDVPWAMAFLPDGRVLVTEQRGALKLYSPGGASRRDSAACAKGQLRRSRRPQ